MEIPLISIIIPTYNRAHLIGKTLDSVLSQTYSCWECIVVDDGSEDNTLEILEYYHKQDSRVQFFIRERQPKGAPTCRNIGLENANGVYIIFLDSDDYLLPYCLEQRHNKIIEMRDYHFLVFPMGIKNKKGTKKRDIVVSDSYLIDFLSANLPWQTMCPIWQRSFLLKLKGFSEGYPRFNDPELMIRALLQDDVRFKVFPDLDYDAVHILSSKVNMEFKDKIYRSLFLLIPDVGRHLEEKNMQENKKYMAYYLRLWFKYFYIPLGKSDINQSIQLIRMFKNQGIISFSKATNFIFRLLLYAMSNFALKQPINKLSDRSLYN